MAEELQGHANTQDQTCKAKGQCTSLIYSHLVEDVLILICGVVRTAEVSDVPACVMIREHFVRSKAADQKRREREGKKVLQMMKTYETLR